MKKTANPFKNSDTNKRYYTFDCYLKRRFGKKCAKIPLDGGFSCPNIDGKVGTGGCIYCSPRGSGDFASPAFLPLSTQFENGVKLVSGKWQNAGYIPYFQAHTNTYAPLGVLKEKFEEVLKYENVVGLSVATRCDCLEDDKIEYLKELSQRTYFTLELGLQSAKGNGHITLSVAGIGIEGEHHALLAVLADKLRGGMGTIVWRIQAEHIALHDSRTQTLEVLDSLLAILQVISTHIREFDVKAHLSNHGNIRAELDAGITIPCGNMATGCLGRIEIRIGVLNIKALQRICIVACPEFGKIVQSLVINSARTTRTKHHG